MRARLRRSTSALFEEPLPDELTDAGLDEGDDETLGAEETLPPDRPASDSKKVPGSTGCAAKARAARRNL